MAAVTAEKRLTKMGAKKAKGDQARVALGWICIYRDRLIYRDR